MITHDVRPFQALNLGTLCLFLWTTAAAAQVVPPARDWGAMADEVRQRPELAERLKAMIASARKVAATPIVKRVYHYGDIGKDRTGLDGRAKFMDGQPRQEWFGLAMSDYGTSGTILTELPLLAFAYRCTGEEAFRADHQPTGGDGHLVAAAASGLAALHAGARPGPGRLLGRQLARDRQGIRGIADTLELMPAGSVPPELMDKLRTLLRAEIKTISDDWKLKRGWFRGGGACRRPINGCCPPRG